jgi:uncharacterized protein (DUF2141 family)
MEVGMKRLVLPAILTAVMCSFVWAAETGNISVKMDGFPSGLGRVSVVLFKSKDGWPKDPTKAVKVMRTGIKNGMANVTFKGLPYGEYAFVILHDANANGKMDYDFVGRPKEAYAFSNNATGMVGAPPFGKAKFKLDKSSVTQSIDMIQP